MSPTEKMKLRQRITKFAWQAAVVGAFAYGTLVLPNSDQETVAPQRTTSTLKQSLCNADLLEGIATKDFTPFGAVTGENYKLPSESPSDMTSYYNLHAKLNPQDDSGIITPGNVYRALDLNGDGKIKGLIPFNKDRRLDDIAEELTLSGLIKRQNPFQLYSGRCDTSKTYKAGEK